MLHDMSPRNKFFAVISGVVVLCMFFAAVLLPNTHGHKALVNTPTSSVKDPTSGEDIPVVDPNNPQYDKVASNTPTFSGFTQLIPLGVDLTQVITMQYAFSIYPPFAHSSSFISLAANDLNPFTPDPNDPLGKIRIDSHVVVRGKATYHISMYFWGLANVELVINDATGKAQLFDSGALANTDIPKNT